RGTELPGQLGACGRSARSAHARRLLPARGASGASARARARARSPSGGNPSREVDPAHGGADSLPAEADMGKERMRFNFERLDVFGVALDAVAILDELAEELPDGRGTSETIFAALRTRSHST